MSLAFYVGQRVRKKSGMCSGITGTIVEIDTSDDRSLGVQVDQPGLGLDASDNPKAFAAGAVVFGYPDEHEPILPTRTGREILAMECLPEGPVRVAACA